MKWFIIIFSLPLNYEQVYVRGTHSVRQDFLPLPPLTPAEHEGHAGINNPANSGCERQARKTYCTEKFSQKHHTSHEYKK